MAPCVASVGAEPVQEGQARDWQLGVPDFVPSWQVEATEEFRCCPGPCLESQMGAGCRCLGASGRFGSRGESEAASGSSIRCFPFSLFLGHRQGAGLSVQGSLGRTRRWGEQSAQGGRRGPRSLRTKILSSDRRPGSGAGISASAVAAQPHLGSHLAGRVVPPARDHLKHLWALVMHTPRRSRSPKEARPRFFAPFFF